MCLTSHRHRSTHRCSISLLLRGLCHLLQNSPISPASCQIRKRSPESVGIEVAVVRRRAGTDRTPSISGRTEKSGRARPILVKIGRLRANSVWDRPTSARNRRSSSNTLPGIDQGWPGIDQRWRKFGGRCGPNSANIDQPRPMDQHRQHRLVWLNLGRIRTTSNNTQRGNPSPERPCLGRVPHHRTKAGNGQPLVPNIAGSRGVGVGDRATSDVQCRRPGRSEFVRACGQRRAQRLADAGADIVPTLVSFG